MADIVGVGHVALDHVFSLAGRLKAGAKNPAQGQRSLVGGMTANAVLAARRLGARARIVSPVGHDVALPLFRAHFEREGIDASGLHPVAGAGSSVSAVVVDERGERTIVNHRGSALALAGDFDPARLDGADVLLTDPRCVAWAEAALRHARRRGMTSVLDADASPAADLQRLVGLAQWAVFSEPGAVAYAGSDVRTVLAGALRAGAAVAVVTQGERGLWWQRAGGTPRQLAAFAVNPVVDTLAAGDVFHGALAVALAEGLGDEPALRLASAAAALKCTRPDGALGAPSRAEVQSLLDRA